MNSSLMKGGAMNTAILLMPSELLFVCHLKKLLDSKGWTQSGLHRRSGVSLTTIRGLTSGAKIERIDRGSTSRLLKALECDFADLYSIKWLDQEENS